MGYWHLRNAIMTPYWVGLHILLTHSKSLCHRLSALMLNLTIVLFCQLISGKCQPRPVASRRLFDLRLVYAHTVYFPTLMA